MTQPNFFTIGHHYHRICNPLSEEKIDRLLPLLELQSGARVLDLGCGKGELLIRLASHYEIKGLGLDIDPQILAQGRENIKSRVPGSQIELEEKDGSKYQPENPFDLVICMGAGDIFSHQRATLQNLKKLTCARGYILWGEGYWKKDPDPEYLDFLGAKRDHYLQHAGNVALAEEEGLSPLYSQVSSQDEWDHYEGAYSLCLERYILNHENDPRVEKMKERIVNWRRAYYKWGRDTLGFGLYLLQNSV